MKRSLEVILVCLAGFLVNSCGFLGGGGGDRSGKIQKKEQGIHCQYADGPLPKYIVVDSQVECQAYNDVGEPKGDIKNIKVDNCAFYASHTIGGSVTHFEAKWSDTRPHPCQLSFDSTRVDFERDGDTYRAKRYVDGVLQEEVVLACEMGSAEGEYDDRDCDDVKSSSLSIPASVREPSVVCSVPLDADRYCFEYFGVSPLEASQLSYIEHCNLSPEARNDICSDGGYQANLCEFELDAGKRVLAWYRLTNETGEELCDRLKAVGEFDKLMP